MEKVRIKSFLDIEYKKLPLYEDVDKNPTRPWKLSHAILFLCILITSGVAGYYLFQCFVLFCDLNFSQTQHDSTQHQCNIQENNRFDCWPEKVGATPDLCAKRGCCWHPSSHPDTAPYCFFPSNYDGYVATKVRSTTFGLEATLKRNSSSFYPPDVKELKLQIDFQTDSRFRIKIYDLKNDRYEVPLAVPSNTLKSSSPQYAVSITNSPFSILVTRKSTGEKIFDTTATAPLIFEDQFLQIGVKLSTKFVYGLGEHRNNFLIDVSKWGRYVFWNRDDVPKPANNGYGTHPFFLNLERGRDSNMEGTQNNSHGILLLNSNAGEVAFQPYGDGNDGAITYRFLGGILDFFVVMGPEPEKITPQLVDIIGKPYLPPFWALGFHLCRWGYNSTSELKKVIQRNRDAQMPYDVQWNDIDYMDGQKDWTIDPIKYKGLPDAVKDLHDNNQRYVLMADPAICSNEPPGTYPPFDDGKQMDIFIKDDKGDILMGWVWPGQTAFPDFFHPNAEEFWYKQAKSFHDILPFDGLWIDMNEPSNFVTGSIHGCPKSSYNHPPFVPATVDSGSLPAKTICPSANQNLSSHYNLHNMYGWSQANVTRRVLDKLLGTRSLIITRSTFPGSGVNAGHWLGDNLASYTDMYYSIPGILNFNLFGLPQVGVDICGFRGPTSSELCTRWMQLGTFYPFMRNHNDLTSPDQDPAAFPSPYKDHMRSALQLRYSLLAVFYTAFFQAYIEGLSIVRPLMFYYQGTESIDKQFMLGDQLLISPVLTQGAVTVEAYLPWDVWYDFYNGTRLSKVGQFVVLDAPLDRINVHVRGGSILPIMPPTQRTDLSRMERFELLCAPDFKGNAVGHLFWDDGQSLDSVLRNKYTKVVFFMNHYNSLSSDVLLSGYKPEGAFRLGKITVLDVKEKPTHVTVNGKKATFSFNPETKSLTVIHLDEDMTSPISASWS